VALTFYKKHTFSCRKTRHQCSRKYTSRINLAVVTKKTEHQGHYFWKYLAEAMAKSRAAKANVCRNLTEAVS